jgi:hypothetical protein
MTVRGATSRRTADLSRVVFVGALRLVMNDRAVHGFLCIRSSGTLEKPTGGRFDPGFRDAPSSMEGQLQAELGKTSAFFV